jgi:hypothetical protein
MARSFGKHPVIAIALGKNARTQNRNHRVISPLAVAARNTRHGKQDDEKLEKEK